MLERITPHSHRDARHLTDTFESGAHLDLGRRTYSTCITAHGKCGHLSELPEVYARFLLLCTHSNQSSREGPWTACCQTRCYYLIDRSDMRLSDGENVNKYGRNGSVQWLAFIAARKVLEVDGSVKGQPLEGPGSFLFQCQYVQRLP